MSNQTASTVYEWATKKGWSVAPNSDDVIQISSPDQGTSIDGMVLLSEDRMILDLTGQVQGDYRIIEVNFDGRPIVLLEMLAEVCSGSTNLDEALLKIADRFPESYDVTMDDRLPLSASRSDSSEVQQ